MSVSSLPAAAQARSKRRYGVCAGCQTTRLVRRDGKVCKHGWPWSDERRCPGENTTPIPIPVKGVDSDHGDVPIAPSSKGLDRWGYLSIPLRSLLISTGATVQEIAPPDLDFQGRILTARGRGRWVRWVLSMPIGQDRLERDLVIRGLLAAAHGVDVSDWPVAMVLRPA